MIFCQCSYHSWHYWYNILKQWDNFQFICSLIVWICDCWLKDDTFKKKQKLLKFLFAYLVHRHVLSYIKSCIPQVNLIHLQVCLFHYRKCKRTAVWLSLIFVIQSFKGVEGRVSVARFPSVWVYWRLHTKLNYQHTFIWVSIVLLGPLYLSYSSSLLVHTRNINIQNIHVHK